MHDTIETCETESDECNGLAPRLQVGSMDIKRATDTRARVLGGFFTYQKKRGPFALLFVRRLLLSSPSSSVRSINLCELNAQHRGVTKRRRVRSSVASTSTANEHAREFTVQGTIFGTNLGNVVEYLRGRGLPAETANLLRSIRGQLNEAAKAIPQMQGADRLHLARGLASCKILEEQANSIKKAEPEVFGKIDSRSGSAAVAIGATASLLIVFGIMGEVPSHAAHFAADHSLIKAIGVVEESMLSWTRNGNFLPSTSVDAFYAELRCLQRAKLGARTARRIYSNLNFETAATCSGCFLLQLEWARRAAFPQAKTVIDAETHDQIMTILEDEGFYHTVVHGAGKAAAAEQSQLTQMAQMAQMAQPPVTVVPLSELSGGCVGGVGGVGGSDRRSESDSDNASRSSFASRSSGMPSSPAVSCASQSSQSSGGSLLGKRIFVMEL